MPQPASEEIRQKWTQSILKQRESGLSIGAWCRLNNISAHTFRYWQKKLFPKPAIDPSDFKEILEKQNPSFPRKPTGVSLKFHRVDIHVEEDFDPLILGPCLKALKEMLC